MSVRSPQGSRWALLVLPAWHAHCIIDSGTRAIVLGKYYFVKFGPISPVRLHTSEFKHTPPVDHFVVKLWLAHCTPPPS